MASWAAKVMMSRFLLAGLFLLSFSACAPWSTPSLPPPRVYITHPALPTPTATLLPTPTAPVTSPLAILAQQTYGARLIQRLRIPTLGVDSAVIPLGWRQDSAGNVTWDSPQEAVGWVISSALPDRPGNIILYGHNNTSGAVFRDLWRLQPDAPIFLQTAQQEWEYRVRQVNILPALLDPTAGAEYLQASPTPRLTLISCWPPQSNTHRVIVLAEP